MPQPTTPVDSPSNPLQRLRSIRKRTVEGVVIVALLLLLVAFILVDRRLQNDVAQAEVTLVALQRELFSLQTPEPPVLALMSTLTTTRALAEQIRVAAPANVIYWPQLATALGQYNPERILLTSLTQVERRMTITGQASSEEAVVAYAQAIEASALFRTVAVQSIRIVPAPTATPLATGTATPAATLVPQATLPAFFAAATTLADFVIIVELNEPLN